MRSAAGESEGMWQQRRGYSLSLRSRETFRNSGRVSRTLGCILGNYFSLIAFASAEQHVPFFTMLNSADPSKVISAMWEDFVSMSILFYALAAYEGYKFSAIRPSNVFSALESASQPQTAGVVQTDQRTLSVRKNAR